LDSTFASRFRRTKGRECQIRSASTARAEFDLDQSIGPRLRHPSGVDHEQGRHLMSDGEVMYLAMVIIAAATFAVSLAWAARRSARH
jgi:hypothetical protein